MRYANRLVVRIYERSPAWSRSFFSSLYGVMKNCKEQTNLYRTYLAELEQSQWWSKEKLEQLQCERLQRLISYVSKGVPYYQKVFAQYGINPNQIQTPADLKKLPMLSKKDVKINTKELISRDYNVKNLRSEATSGTTGSPLTVYMNNEAYIYNRAVQTLRFSWAGYNGTEKIAIMGGYKVVPISQKNPPFWITNYWNNQIHMSTYHLGYDTWKYYFDKLRGAKVKFLRGYPSAVGLLAKFISQNNKYLPLKAVILGSEPIYEWQKIAIKGAFNCPIYNNYSQAERVLSGANCGSSRNLHLIMEAGIAEFEPSPYINGKYNMVATSLVNYGMPLIRYQLGDITSFVSVNCSCGRKYQMISPVETKLEDFIITPSGKFISASLLTFPFKKAKSIISSQIVQYDINKLMVNIVTNKLFSNDDKKDLIRNIESCIEKGMHIKVKKVNEIARTENGKHRFVISNYSQAIINDDINRLKN